MRERAVPSDLHAERRDPRALRRMLSWRLSGDVKRRIEALYSVPRPKGYATDTGYDRPRGGSTGDAETAALDLGSALVAWLELDPDPVDLSDRAWLLALAARADERALAWLTKQAPSDDELERAYALVVIYLAWLGRSCSHPRARNDGRVIDCPDCDLIEVRDA